MDGWIGWVDGCIDGWMLMFFTFAHPQVTVVSSDNHCRHAAIGSLGGYIHM